MNKTWDELGLDNNFIFQKVMLNEEICKRVLTEIIGKEVVKIKYATYEKTISIRADAKAIRLDVYIKDEEDTVYNIEMQNTNEKDLIKRGRYYHDLIDLDLIEKGEIYDKLNKSYVIFICSFDMFGKGLYQYTFKNKCDEIDGLCLNDEVTTIYMNTEGHKGAISEECKMFLKAVKGIFTNDEFSAILEKEIERVKSSGKWRKEYMNLEVFMYDERKKGIKEGKEQGLKEGMIKTKTLTKQLYHCLKNDNRLDDWEKSLEDEALYEQLLEEYHIK